MISIYQKINKDSIIAFLCIIIFTLVILLIRNKNKDNFCNCAQVGNKVYIDPQVLKQLYAENKLTEYNFPPRQI